MIRILVLLPIQAIGLCNIKLACASVHNILM